MEIVRLSRSSLRAKSDRCIRKYLSLSNDQAISVGLYVKGKAYVLDFGKDEADLYYDIGSVSKTITAHLVLKVFEELRRDLNSPVSDFIPLRKGNYPTVYELLTHTAGYRHLTPVEITVPRLIRHRYSHRNVYENVTEEDVIKALERRNGSKGKHSYGYSDFSYAILAIVLEKIKSNPFIS